VDRGISRSEAVRCAGEEALNLRLILKLILLVAMVFLLVVFSKTGLDFVYRAF
jgi:hypothetical protein